MLLDPRNVLVFFSLLLTFLYVWSVLNLLRKNFVSKIFHVKQEVLDKFLNYLKSTSKLLKNAKDFKFYEKIAKLEELHNPLSSSLDKRLLFVVDALLNARMVGETFKETWQGPASLLSEIGNRFNDLQKAVWNVKENEVFIDLCEICYSVITGESPRHSPSVRHEFLGDLRELRRCLVQVDLDRLGKNEWESFSKLEDCLWNFFCKWSENHEDAISFSVAVLLNFDLTVVETWPPYWTNYAKEAFVEFLKFLTEKLDKTVIELEGAKYNELLFHMSLIHAYVLKRDKACSEGM